MSKAERKQYEANRQARIAEANAIVATGHCPSCGTGLIRNLALAGWWQCGGYASQGFRRPGFESAPKCDFQIFTE